jgi:hypothetical protein
MEELSKKQAVRNMLLGAFFVAVSVSMGALAILSINVVMGLPR